VAARVWPVWDVGAGAAGRDALVLKYLDSTARVDRPAIIATPRVNVIAGFMRRLVETIELIVEVLDEVLPFSCRKFFSRHVTAAL